MLDFVKTDHELEYVILKLDYAWSDGTKKKRGWF